MEFLEARADFEHARAGVDHSEKQIARGKEVIKELLVFDPEVTAIVSSGYSKDPVMANYQEYGFSAVLAKPLRLEEVARVVNDTVNSSSDRDLSLSA